MLQSINGNRLLHRLFSRSRSHDFNVRFNVQPYTPPPPCEADFDAYQTSPTHTSFGSQIRKYVQIRTSSPLWEQSPSHVIYHLSKMSPYRYVSHCFPHPHPPLSIFLGEPGPRGITPAHIKKQKTFSQATLRTSAKPLGRTSRARRARRS